MSELLVIRLSDTKNGICEAVILTDGAVSSTVYSGTLSDLLPHAANRKVAVIVSGVDVLHTRAAIPVKGAAKILQAIPFALEEQIAQDVGALHFAVGKREADGTVNAAVLEHELITGWRDRLEQAGVHANTMISDLSMLPRHDDAAVAVIDGDDVLFRCPGGDVLQDSAENIALLVDLCAFSLEQETNEDESDAESTEDDSEEPQHDIDGGLPGNLPRLIVYGLPETLAARERQLGEVALRVDTLEQREISQHPLRLLARGANAEPGPINLLQGEYAPKTAISTLWQPWRVAAGLLVAFIATALGAQAIELLQLRAQETALDARIASVLQTACPGNAAIVDPRVQMQRCVADRGGSIAGQEVFLNMLGTVGSVFADTPNTKINQISFRNRIMDLKVTAPSVEALDRIKQLVAERGGLEMVIESTSPDGNIVQSQIEIRKPTA